MTLLFHQCAKDIRQRRRLLAAWLAVLALRAAIVALPIDAWYPALAQGTIAGVYLALNIAALALTVVIVVLFVHADPAAGTTAFWVTRPVSRRTMAASKLALVFVVFVAVPVLFDAAALGANRISSSDIVRATWQGTFERLALVLPVVGLAALTVDLATFALAALGALAGLLASVVLVTLLFSRAGPTHAFPSSLLVNLVTLMAAGVAVAWAQYLRRDRRGTVPAVVLVLAACALLVRFWQVDLLSIERHPDAGWLAGQRIEVWVTGRVDVGRPWPADKVTTVNADVAASASTESLVVAPVGLDARLTLPNAGRVTLHGSERRGNLALYGGASGGTDRAAAAAVGRVRLLKERGGADGSRSRLPLISLEERELAEAERVGGRYEANVRLLATAFEAGRGVPLRVEASGAAGDRRFRVLAAECGDGRCDVLLRDVVAIFAYDDRVPSRVNYLLVNRRRGTALPPVSVAHPVLGEAGYALGQHLAITQHALRFEPSDGEAGSVDAAWLTEAELVPVVATELGHFTRPLVIPDFREVLWAARDTRPKADATPRVPRAGQGANR